VIGSLSRQSGKAGAHADRCSVRIGEVMAHLPCSKAGATTKQSRHIGSCEYRLRSCDDGGVYAPPPLKLIATWQRASAYWAKVNVNHRIAPAAKSTRAGPDR
jgi:hypothetical protein